MIVLGVDPSISDTGYAIMKNKKLVHYGHVKTSSKDEYMGRMQVFYKTIQDLCTKYKPDTLAIETQYINFSGFSSNSILKVTELKGVIEGAYWSIVESGLVIDINPKTVKSYIGLPIKAKREEAKIASLAYVNDNYKTFSSKNNNESDAVLIALCAFDHVV